MKFFAVLESWCFWVGPMIAAGCVGRHLVTFVLLPLTRHSQRDLFKRRRTLGQVEQRFPPRQGNNCPSSNIFSLQDLVSDVRYVKLSPRPRCRSVSQDLVKESACDQDLRHLSVQTETRFQPVFCDFSVDEGFALPAFLHYFPLPILCIRGPVSWWDFRRFLSLVWGLLGPFQPQVSHGHPIWCCTWHVLEPTKRLLF